LLRQSMVEEGLELSSERRLAVHAVPPLRKAFSQARPNSSEVAVM
jgi:hypothetical protein